MSPVQKIVWEAPMRFLSGGVPIRPRSTLLACTLLSTVGCAPHAVAMDLYVFDGACIESRVKAGADATDLTHEPGSPITCNVAILTTSMPNGHAMIQFGTKTDRAAGPLTFGGPGISHTLNPKMAVMPVERVYPRLPLDATPAETNDEHRERKPLDGQGFCFFQTQDVASARELDCVGKVESDGHKTMYTIKFKVSHVDLKRNV